MLRDQAWASGYIPALGDVDSSIEHSILNKLQLIVLFCRIQAPFAPRDSSAILHFRLCHSDQMGAQSQRAEDQMRKDKRI